MPIRRGESASLPALRCRIKSRRDHLVIRYDEIIKFQIKTLLFFQ